ncbi:hypothetical protein CVT24_002415 [Panaeolus cyanescens]|uniref:Uncharacterized protein n=1 Tax=Panaeolus cyanescens TaxID=181874 RepID=A0A409W0W9_9AGAR|nr:hypothetical protein CVT24_002415 [Panaeolus cyanescens]
MSPFRSPLSRLHKASAPLKSDRSRSSSPHPLDDIAGSSIHPPAGRVLFEEGSRPIKPSKIAIMKPESKAYQARMRSKMARMREAAATREDLESVISLSSSENLGDLDAGDSMYRGPTKQSKVFCDSGHDHMSPPVTRRTASSKRVNLGKTDSDDVNNPLRSRVTPRPLKNKADVIDIPSDDEDPFMHSIDVKPSLSERGLLPPIAPMTPPRVRPRPIKKTMNIPPSIDDDEIGDTARLMPANKRKRYETPTKPRLSQSKHRDAMSEDELPMDDEHWSPPRRVAPPLRNTFIDDEAAEEDIGLASDRADDLDLDEYDLQDDFIDDSPIQPPKRSRKSNTKSSSVRDRLQTRPIRGALKTPKADDIIDHENTSSVRNMSDKRAGKLKAIAIQNTSSLSEDEDGDLEDANDLSPYERKELRLALRRSRQDVSSSPKEGQPSSSTRNSARKTANTHTPAKPVDIDLTEPDLSTPSPTSSSSNVSPSSHVGLATPATTPVASSASSSSSVPVSTTPARRGFTSIADYIARIPGAAAALQTPTNVDTVVRCGTLPAVCEVNDPSTHDVILQNDYASLPPLKKGTLEPYAVPQSPDYELIRFIDWVQLNPNLNADLALDFVRFCLSGNKGNVSRCSPREVELREMRSASRQAQVYRNGKPFIGVTTGKVDWSQLTTVGPAGIQQKFIRIIMHAQEGPRFEAWLCMVFGHSTMASQMFRNVMPFTTRSAPARVVNNTAPFDPHAPHFVVNPTTFSLPYNAIIPVYDATNTVAFDVNTDLDRLPEVLPRWMHGEVPRGSFAVVGYTISEYYSKAGKWTLSCNLLWIIVLAVPTAEPAASPA